MIEIKTNQELEVNNLLSFRGKLRQNEVESIGREMEISIKSIGAKCVGSPIIATHGIENGMLDVELLMPIDNTVLDFDKYVFKNKLKIVNAVKLEYKGNPMGLQAACNELNQYMIDDKLQPITVGYNVTKHVEPYNLDNTEIDVYVGVSPNVL